MTRYEEALALSDEASALLDRSKAAGIEKAIELASVGYSKAATAASDFEAASINERPGRHNRAWALRSAGTRHMKQARNYLDKARAAFPASQ